MKTGTSQAVLLSVGIIATLVTAAPDALAQVDEDEVLEEIIVVGTRRQTRTLANTPVPVDILQGVEFRRMGATDINDMLRTLLPSYNVERFPLDDESSLVRPATLRGLPPAYTLTLINGKRFHRSGAINGSQASDLSVIPTIAMSRVEVLRDGASAQYGSDAIAGVVNFVARDANSGFTAELKTGQYYEGDGRDNQVGVNWGLPMTDRGFVNLSLEYGDRDATSRAIQDPVGASLTELGLPDVPNPTQNWGQPRINKEIRAFVNSALEVGDDGEIYGFGNYDFREQELEFFWRPPHSQLGIFTVFRDRLVFDLTSDGSGNCPTAFTPTAIPTLPLLDPSQAEFDADQAALAAIESDPNCWVLNELYPAGYRPLFGAEQTDYGATIGYRNKWESGVRYDVSGTWGRNELDFTLRDSINASMGPSSPTSFRPGKTIQTETSLNFDVVWPIAVSAFNSPLNFATGLEWRDEIFEKVTGDEPSWAIGPLAAQGAVTGSHGFPGIPPNQSGRWSRSNWAVYLDLEADITEKLLLGFAVRYEDFEDFGSTTNYKGSFRYAFNDVFAMRASASTGYRAPTPSMIHTSDLSTISRGSFGGLTQVGRIPPTNPVAIFYGGQPLEPEEAENISIGITLQPMDNLTITADYFQIEISNRIEIGESFRPTPEDIAALEALGYPGAASLEEIEFYVNTTLRTTEGFDIVATYAVDWRGSSSSDFTLAWNHTDYTLSQDDNVSRRRYVNNANRPKNRGIFTFNHFWNDIRFLLRASYYSSWAQADWSNDVFEPVCTEERPNPAGTDHCYGDAWIVDAEIAYTFRDRYTVVVGADNVFDTVPELNYLYPDFSRGRIYPDESPYDYHGGFWYFRFRAEF